MTFFKSPDGYFHIRFRGPDGKLIRRSTGLKDRREAKEWIRSSGIADMDTAARMGVLTKEVAFLMRTGRPRTKTVRDVIEPWQEYMVYRHCSERTIHHATIWIKAWATWAKAFDRCVDTLRIEDFDGWLNADCQNKLGSRKVMLSALRGFCKFCKESGWMEGNPANLLVIDMDNLAHAQKETFKRPCFTEDEVNLLIAATALGGACEDEFYHPAIIIGRYTGLRLGDIACLEWESLNLPANTITVWTEKRDRRISLPLEPDLLRLTCELLPMLHARYVFNNERYLAEDVGDRCLLSTRFTAIVRLMGIPTVKTFHSLRATYVSDCNARGIPMEHISKNVGHASVRTTAGYVRASADQGAPAPFSPAATPAATASEIAVT